MDEPKRNIWIPTWDSAKHEIGALLGFALLIVVHVLGGVSGGFVGWFLVAVFVFDRYLTAVRRTAARDVARLLAESMDGWRECQEHLGRTVHENIALKQTIKLEAPNNLLVYNRSKPHDA